MLITRPLQQILSLITTAISVIGIMSIVGIITSDKNDSQSFLQIVNCAKSNVYNFTFSPDIFETFQWRLLTHFDRHFHTLSLSLSLSLFVYNSL